MEEQGWTKEPFAGEISDGYVWGRGALDIKFTIVAIMEAAEALLAEGFSPERTYCIAFGADEEVGGARGAGAIGAELKRRGMRFEYLVDEGAMIVEGALSFMKGPAALIGVAEKGHVNYEVTARGKRAHASPSSLERPASSGPSSWRPSRAAPAPTPCCARPGR